MAAPLNQNATGHFGQDAIAIARLRKAGAVVAAALTASATMLSRHAGLNPI
jgi:hypothetical protein